ncbi:MAG: CoA-binding protein [Endomicrobium sp.]|nr:CoA-binding protein [Endomicrobium sp.]
MYKNRVIAIVGVSSNKDKFGHKIFVDLLKTGFRVFAIGTRGGNILGETIYGSLKCLPKKPDVVVTVVSPVSTEKIVDDTISLEIKEIWMQSGSASEEAVKKAKSAGIKVTDRGCFMVANGIW